MLHCGNYKPVPFAHSTVAYTVTFPVLPYENADITEVSEQQSVYSSSGSTSEATCEKCRLEKKKSLNRQLYELVKKHGLLEVAGKEILGWYMLLPAEDRRFIKEYGHISEYIKENPSLLIVDNWVQLKRCSMGAECSTIISSFVAWWEEDFIFSDHYPIHTVSILHVESAKILESSSNTYSFSMEKSQSCEDNCRTSYTQDYCDRMLRSFGHAALNPLSDTLWFEGVNDLKKADLDARNSNAGACDAKLLELEMWNTSKIGEHKIAFDTENSKDSSSPVLPLDVPNNQDTASVTSDVTKEPFIEKPFVNNYRVVSKESSECELSRHMKLKTDQTFKERESSVSSYENAKIIDRSFVIKSKDNSSNCERSQGVVAHDEMKSISPWLQCTSEVTDNLDCSSVDDETFFSVKSGSFYSRSSSPCSLDDSTDVEQCDFEEALEDLSSFSLYRQSRCGDVQSPMWDLTNEQITFVEKNSMRSKAKQKNVSCNTDISWLSLSYDNKETQTNEITTQDTGLNTDPIEGGLFSQTWATALKDKKIAKDVEEVKGTRGSSSSPEDLLQRAVKAELHLVDVQRWLCWQMCWKTQQQTIEKQSFFNLPKEPSEPSTQSTSMTNFSLSSALAEVEEKYQEMRAKIQSGIPLDTLVSLPMQLPTVKTSTDNLLKDTCLHNERQDDPDVPAEDFKGSRFMKNDLETPFMSSLDKCEQKPSEIHSTEHLSEKPSHYYVHVGNIAHCVTEVELMDLFKKYNVSNVFLEASSLTCCYAVLTFSKSEEAEAAIREMDGKMLYGKKLKVRSIRTSNYNLSVAFQKITSVSREIPPEGKGFHSTDPKESVVLEPPKSDCTQSVQVPSDHTHVASVGNLPNAFVNLPSKEYYPFTNTDQGIPAAPPRTTAGCSNFMPPGYQCMLQSHQSHLISYNNMPNFMYVPFSYPLYQMPNHLPFQPSVAHPNNCVPGINMASNVHIAYGKDAGYPEHGKPVRSIHSTNRKNSYRTSPSIVQRKLTSSNDKTKLLGRDIGAKFVEDKPATVKPVNEPAVSCTTSSNAELHHSETASQDNPLKLSSTTSSVCSVGNTVADNLSSCDGQTVFSGPSNFKSAAPLRCPTFVPPSVTIPETIKPSVNRSSADQTEVESTITSKQGDSLPTGITDWGVYPRLTSSELPITIIPNQLNFSQFKKVVKHLSELHKGAKRDQIVRTLEDIRTNRGGTFGGLTIPEIIYAASSKLAGNIPPA